MTPQERQSWVGSMGARTKWWARCSEPAYEPDWEIIDTHCHLWTERDFPDPADTSHMMRTSTFMEEEFLAVTDGGHALTEFVYIECGSGHETTGPQHLRPVGESRFAVELAKTLDGQAGRPRLGAIAAFADLSHPGLGMVLDAHAKASNGLVRAIRHSGARLENPAERLLAGGARAGLYAEPEFRRGVALLGARNLAFEAFQFHFQLHELAELIEAAPLTRIIVNHLGGPIGYSADAEVDAAIFGEWAKAIEAIAKYDNVILKLGGIASPVTTYDAHLRDTPPSSDTFVAERGKYFDHAIKVFGPERCMFETNFPVDSVAISYTNLWNAYKKIASQHASAARTALLSGTARAVYGLNPASAPTHKHAAPAPV